MSVVQDTKARLAAFTREQKQRREAAAAAAHVSAAEPQVLAEASDLESPNPRPSPSIPSASPLLATLAPWRSIPSSSENAAVGGETELRLGVPPVTGHLEVKDLPLEAILDSPYQPRVRALTKKDVEDLMRSLAASGQTAPIVVTPGTETGKYIVHAGHRRCAALRFLDAKTVKAIVRTDLDERGARRLVLADNLGREDLSAYEQATALGEYCKAFEVSVEVAAGELGVRRTTGYRLSAILSVSSDLQDVLREERISAHAAEYLAKLDSKDVRAAVKLARRFAAGAITLKGLEDEVQKTADKAARRAGALHDVLVKIDRRGAELHLKLPQAERTEAQVVRVLNAMAQVLRHLGVSKLDASEVTRAGDCTSGADGGRGRRD